MNQRIFTLVLALLMAVSLAACGGNDPTETQAPSGSDLSTEATAVSEATEAPRAEFPETVLVDDETCTVKLTAIEEDSIWGYTLKAYLENKTNIELTFSLEDVSVNGFMCDPFWAASVTPGMKSNEDISFLSSDFEMNDITTPTVIEFTLRVHDANDYTADDLVKQVFTIYPLGEEAVEEFVRTPVEGEIVLFDNEYATMIVTGADPVNIWGYGLNVFLENKTEKSLMFSASDVSVNGFMCDPFWATEVAPGKRSNTTISWFSDDFEENGITEVESITLPISVSDADDWLAEDLVNESFTIDFNS